MAINSDFQPDFVITIGGTNVTKFVQGWELEDLEDAISRFSVTLANPEGRFSGKFGDGDKMAIRFGYQGNLGEKATFDLKEDAENYGLRGDYVILTGLDPAARLTGTAMRGTFYNNPSVQAVLKEIGEIHGLRVKIGEGIKDPKLRENKDIQALNERQYGLMRRLMSMLAVQKAGAAKVGNVGSATKAIKQQRQPKKKGSFVGTMRNGFLANRSGGAAYASVEEQANNTGRNYIQGITAQASSISIHGVLELKGVPMLRAKKCLTVSNVGPKYSGKWYARGVRHRWSVCSGYLTAADLLREGQGPGQDQPIVMHADIYSEDTLQIQTRDMQGESQATFTRGDGEAVIAFKAGTQVQGSKEAGEGSQVKKTFFDADPAYVPGAFGM